MAIASHFNGESPNPVVSRPCQRGAHCEEEMEENNMSFDALTIGGLLVAVLSGGFLVGVVSHNRPASELRHVQPIHVQQTDAAEVAANRANHS